MFRRIKNGTVTSPRGFLAAGIHCGIKKHKLDLALIRSTRGARAAACFTRNTVKAWPVLYCQQAIKFKSHRAILANSGNANCFNGTSGKRAVTKTVKALARELDLRENEILVASTGVIGKSFPTKKVLKGAPVLVRELSKENGNKAAQAILTTDTRTKEIGVSFTLEGKEVILGGIAKGAGMVNPNMATMLTFFTTDCAISKPMLARALREAVYETFNHISIDTDMSTNDCVFILANGLAGNPMITRRGKSFRVFLSNLKKVCRFMAKALVKDGEGVTRVCEIKVKGAKSDLEASTAARQVASSMLFKTMLAGGDPNWGRVVAALGASRVKMDLSKIALAFEGIKILQQGKVLKGNLPLIRKALNHKEITLEVNLNMGSGEARFLTCDLTRAYVRINSWYTT